MLLGGDHGSVSDIEIMWTLIALFGIFFSLYNLREAFADIKAIEENKIGNGRRVIAHAFRLSEFTRLVKQLIFLAIGIIAMSLPPAPPVHLPLNIRIFTWVFTWGLIVAALLTSYQSYLTHRVRQQILGGAYDRTSAGLPNTAAQNTATGKANDLPNGTVKVEGTISVKDE